MGARKRPNSLLERTVGSLIAGRAAKIPQNGAELVNLMGAMNDIHNTLAHSLVSTPSVILFQQLLIMIVVTEYPSTFPPV